MSKTIEEWLDGNERDREATHGYEYATFDHPPYSVGVEYHHLDVEGAARQHKLDVGFARDYPTYHSQPGVLRRQVGPWEVVENIPEV